MRGNNQKLSNEIVDLRLSGRSIKRIGDYVNSKTPLEWLCLVCGHKWFAVSSGILYSNTGCIQCANKENANRRRFSNEEIDLKIQGKNLIRLEDYINYGTKIKWQCTICLKILNIRPADIIHGNIGCSRCSGKEQLTNEIIDQRLEGRSVKRVGDYISMNESIEWQCLDCDLIWTVQPRSIIHNNIWMACPGDIFTGYGCPVCKFKNERLIYSLLKRYGIIFEYHHKFVNSNYDTDFIVDFYFPPLNLIIEYNGLQHYQPVRFGGMLMERAQVNFEKQIIRDTQLSSFCNEMSLTLIWIDGRKYHDRKLEQYIEDEIIPLLFKLNGSVQII